MIASDIKDKKLAAAGKAKILWAGLDMPVLKIIEQDFSKRKPFKGIRIAACLHVTAETANLCLALKAGGAEIALAASNPLSTQDDVAASLVHDFGVSVFAKKGEDAKTYGSHIKAVLDTHPAIVMDDGADLVSELHEKRRAQIPEIIGSTEETTTGVIRLRALEKEGRLAFPVIGVNESKTKHMFDNRYGTGQSTLDGFIRATNKLIAGSTFVVAGYGWCGKGLASRARGMGARVLVTEIDAVKALEAVMDGFEVAPMARAVREADFICTVTGNKHVLDKAHFLAMKDRCVVANSGHFDIEINIPALKKLSKKVTEVRPNTLEYDLGRKKIYLLAEGRLVNLGSAEGHPASVMDMSFANQAYGLEYLLQHQKTLSPNVYVLPQALDQKIATLKLKALTMNIDTLTSEQKKYLETWNEGTHMA